MSIAAQLTINGLIAGSIYALVASGFSLIYSTNKFMHFAHGTSVAVGGYILYFLFTLLGIHFYVSALLTIILSALLGLGIHKFIYSPMQKKKASNIVLLIASIGILILFENLIQLAFGASVQTIGYVDLGPGLHLFGAIITPLQVILIIIALLFFIFLHFFMKKSRLGRDMRAVSNNKELASIMGIDSKKVTGYAFMIGSGLAGIAGILIGLEQNLYPVMGTELMIKGFTGSVIGGITSVPGSVLGSYLLGLAENYGVWFLPSGYKDAIAFVLLFIFLLVKPSGLFGVDKGVKQ